MRRVVRNNRCLVLRIGILNFANLFLCHIDGRKHKVHFAGHFFDLVHIVENHLFIDFRHRNVQLPTVADRFFIGLTGAPRARCERGHLKPGVVLQYRQKALADHACRAEYADLQFLLRCVKFLTHCSNLRARPARQTVSVWLITILRLFRLGKYVFAQCVHLCLLHGQLRPSAPLSRKNAQSQTDCASHSFYSRLSTKARTSAISAVGSKRFTTFPSLSTTNFVKFHLISGFSA